MKIFYTALIALSALFISFPSAAQITWERTYDNGPSDFGTSVIALSNGYIMCGSTYDALNDDYDVFVTRVDLNGDVVWTNIYTSLGAGDDFAEYINATSDNNFVVCGSSYDPNFDDTDAFVLKVNGAGNEIWHVTLDGGWADYDGANYVVAEGDMLLLCGYTTTSDFDRYSWVFILDEDGDLQWEGLYAVNGDDEATKVIATDDGGFAVAGYSYDWMNGDYDGFLTKVDVFGDEEWTYFTTGTADEFFNDVIIDPFGDFLLVGAQEDEVTGDYDILLENVDYDGSVLYYSYTFDHAGGDDEALRVYYNGSDYFIAGHVQSLTGAYDAYIAVIDVDAGDIDGEVIYGGAYDDGFMDFDFANDGGFICVGLKSLGSKGPIDVYLVKTDANGEVLPPVSVPAITREDMVTIFPNPTTDILNIRGEGIRRYRIMTTDGKLVTEDRLTGNMIDVQDLASGNYILTLFKEDMAVVKKFIKR